MTDPLTETREGYAALHPERGFDFDSFRPVRHMVEYLLAADPGWRVVPVTITITAKAPP